MTKKTLAKYPVSTRRSLTDILFDYSMLMLFSVALLYFLPEDDSGRLPALHIVSFIIMACVTFVKMYYETVRVNVSIDEIALCSIFRTKNLDNTIEFVEIIVNLGSSGIAAYNNQAKVVFTLGSSWKNYACAERWLLSRYPSRPHEQSR